MLHEQRIDPTMAGTVIEAILRVADQPDSEGNIVPAEELKKLADVNRNLFWEPPNLIWRGTGGELVRWRGVRRA